jgi:hypothetical protein
MIRMPKEEAKKGGRGETMRILEEEEGDDEKAINQ